MKRLNLHPAWLSTLNERQRKFVLEQRGAHFVYKFLFKKGHHLFIVGATLSGKTQKAVLGCRMDSNNKGNRDLD